MSPLRVDAITDYETFRSLEPVWNRLLERTDTPVPFLTHEWLSTWWECFGEGADLLVLKVSRGSEPLAFAPLMVHQKDRRVSFVANSQSMRANFLLAEEPAESLRAIFAFLAASGLSWREMVFNYIPEDSAVARLGQAACREARLRVGFLPSLVSPYIPLAGLDWDTYLAQRPHRLRKSLRVHERRLQQREAARCVLYRDPACVEQALEACREISLTTWQHERGGSIASTPQLWEFYQRVSRMAAERGWLRIGILEARGKPAAFDYALVFRRIYSP